MEVGFETIGNAAPIVHDKEPLLATDPPEVGFETIGNATLICHDKKPVLVTDPWLVGGAYFESWSFTHEIPEPQMESILESEYVWISHGHPDHLSGPSLKLLKDKKILLPDHVGSRIYDDLKSLGYDVYKLTDREWVPLSNHIKVLSVADYNQDAILLVNIHGKLIINTNDATDCGWGFFVRKIAKSFKISFLMFLAGYGDADMNNYFDEDGTRILPIAAKKIPFGKNMALRAESYGAAYVIPFSSMHRYQRKDSAWANAYTTPLGDYSIGFSSASCELLPAYIRYDYKKESYELINPPKKGLKLLDPDEIQDSWQNPLDASDVRRIDRYFRSISHLHKTPKRTRWSNPQRGH